MSNLFEITGNDIAQLGDADLRTLIGILCEADYRLAKLPTTGITWGGHQDASDGGLDVVVQSEHSPPLNSSIPRKNTAFQIKKPDMPVAAIINEMRPSGVLRQEIKNLLQEAGAYIIVSARGSTANTALKNRIRAMREAVEGEENHKSLHVDFFDRGRVATWVRSHPSLILWVRNKIGRQLDGWYPYANWASAPGGVDEEYLLDDGLRLHDGAQEREAGLSAKEGLLKLRATLSVPGASVRLAGLSGVGKTRLVQALFDERVAEQPLNRSQAFYTDMSNSPDPEPVMLLEQLIADRARAILIVDNCPPDLHRRLTQTCSASHSTVSLLTVEYDVRDDLPDETSVFRLEPASEEIIAKLIGKRFPHIGQVDAQTIASFSGGNARVAIALANTVQQGETLSSFRDEQLFERLFKQRNDPSETLLRSAEICSLVYSFEGTDANSDKSELKFLSSIIGKTSSELYRDVNTLKARDLIQQRGVWRALLPHAIANRLAKRALESIPKDTIVNAFIHNDSERLIKSFTRRLNFLHDCNVAVEIVNDWLSKDGWLGKENCNFNAFGMEVFKNIAPVSPEKALEAMERAANGEEGDQFTSRENGYFYEFTRLLRHLAYDSKLFDRCVKLLFRYALSEKIGENYNSTRDVLKSLFYIYLSGTHASIEQRAKIIDELVNSDKSDKQELGFFLLSAALETFHFSTAHEFGFGARPRDYGYAPRTHKEIMQWYGAFIDICIGLALSNKPVATRAKKVFSDNLRGLWSNAGMFDAVEKSVSQILECGAWNEGWISVRSIIRYDGNGLKPEIVKRLHKLEKSLKPDSLLERARTYALADQRHMFDLEDDYDDDEDASASWKKVEDATREIGNKVAKNNEVFQELLPALVSTNNMRLHIFGYGLAEGSSNRPELWQTLYTELEKTPSEKRQLQIIQGFLVACSVVDTTLYHSILDKLINDTLLGTSFPLLQTTGTIDKQALDRLHKALDLGKAPVRMYQHIAWGRAHEAISDDNLAELLRKIASKDGGIRVAIEILKMRFHKSNTRQSDHSDKLLAVAREVLSKYPFSGTQRGSDSTDYELAGIADECLNGASSAIAANELCNHFANAIIEDRVYPHDYPQLLSKLASLQPACFMDVFLGNDTIEDYRRRRIFSDNFGSNSNPLNGIADEDIIAWCEIDPENRYPIIAEAIQPFCVSGETEGGLGWKKIIYSILENAPNLKSILSRIADSISPTSWSGSRADILQKRLGLFQIMQEHDNAEVAAWAKNQQSALQEQITNERAWENSRNRERNESFE